MHKDEVIGELSESELRALVPQLQSLTDKYKRSENIQKALYHISELSSSVDNFEKLYQEIHDVVSGFMTADNFFVAFINQKNENIDFAYFVDERDEEVVQSVPYEKIKNGVTAHILRTAEPLVMTKENSQSLLEKHKMEVLGSMPVDFIGIPLLRDEAVIGAMVVQSYNEDVRYDNEDLEILIFISQQIVRAIDRVKHRELTEALIEERTQQLVEINTTLEDEIQERKRMETLQKALFQISEQSGHVEGPIEDFYEKVHGILKTLLDAENCYVATLNDEKTHLSFPYFVGRGNDSTASRKLKNGLTEFVIRRAEACLVDSETAEKLKGKNELDERIIEGLITEKNSWLGAPLIIDNEVIGVISVQTYGYSEDYTSLDLDVLKFVSQHIANAIQRRDSANALLKYNQQLSEKVEERTAELNTSNKSLKKQIEQRKDVELKLIHDAHHDGLTDLPNRVMFNSRLELAIASKHRYHENNFALLFIDLDRFKNINDTLGHHAGDQFLVEVANRITHCKRGHDLLARLGGDEFVILVDSYNDMDDVKAIAQRIVMSIGEPFVIDEKEVFSGASIGITEISHDYKTADEVLRDADAAMYQAKNEGRNRYVIFNIRMREQILEEIEDERMFRSAFKSDQFHYSVQAIRNLDDNKTLYYECAVNWPEHPKCRKSEHFWALADKCGLTLSISDKLMDEAFNLLRSWRNIPDKKHLKIGVSLSIEHLLLNTSFEELLQKIENSRVNTELLVVEISEVALTRFNKHLPSIMQRLQNLGITLVLDNFASQSASLNHLFRYDFDYLKLNQNLVNTFAMSDKYHRLMKSIILIANDMGIGVIGDGIGDEMIMQDLVEIGCHFGQGAFIAPQSNINESKSFSVVSEPN
ncbi:sensor domain-containing diguanylate cyclase [Glaciecola petra]|uniref:Diguanylate cyclase n=1 Tax=Glaciecola petra TaxID=3075602 RepID=A0ABU2ZVL7_9ALTE|nr:diguanylate cyclase [Aestuariibacter sp. P117]MDT0596450.1 diguanylate cyclase [Aestuariibacter sp. P117]